MTKKAPKPYRMVPLQRLTARPIEDPAEQAALDERIRRAAEGSLPGDVTPFAVVEWCGQLSAKERLSVVMELLEQLSVDQRIELVERLAAHLSPEAVRRAEARLRGRAKRGGDRRQGEGWQEAAIRN